jgi:hypothetical protein
MNESNPWKEVQNLPLVDCRPGYATGVFFMCEEPDCRRIHSLATGFATHARLCKIHPLRSSLWTTRQTGQTWMQPQLAIYVYNELRLSYGYILFFTSVFIYLWLDLFHQVPSRTDTCSGFKWVLNNWIIFSSYMQFYSLCRNHVNGG